MMSQVILWLNRKFTLQATVYINKNGRIPKAYIFKPPKNYLKKNRKINLTKVKFKFFNY